MEQRLSFDAWGNPRDPDTWTGTITQQPMFDRGFTGHEHLEMFGLINMNGRMYDPVMSTFLSVDNYVQAPDFSQSFNRYAYCWNNPLRYTDPDGEFLVLSMLVGATFGAAINIAMNFDNIRTDADIVNVATLGALGGAVGGAAGYGASYALSSVMGGMGAIGGGLSSAAGGFAGNFAGTSLTAWCTGATFGDGLMAGLKAGAIGGLTAGLIGAYNGAMDAISSGGNPWTGEGAIIGEYSISSEYSGSTREAQSNAVKYNISYESEMNDRFLKKRTEDIFQVKEGTFNIETISTRGNISRYGLTKEGQYVNLESKRLVRGYTTQVGINGSRVYVSPKYATTIDLAEFKATVGHELIHSFHHFDLGAKFNRFDSEVSAYRYSYRVLSDAGSPEAPGLMKYMREKGYDVKNNPFYLIPF